MIDKDQAQHMTDVAGECNRLNEMSQPLGYAVTASTSVDDQSAQQFTVHRLDQIVASGPKFATIEEVRAHLEAMVPTVHRALEQAGLTLAEVDAIAVTAGPGLAPVLDVFRTPGDFVDEFHRSYSSDPAVVGRLGGAFISAQQRAGVRRRLGLNA